MIATTCRLDHPAATTDDLCYFVQKRVTSMNERAEWIQWELDRPVYNVADLPDVARLFMHFVGEFVRTNQKTVALAMFHRLSSLQIQSEGRIVPFAVQEKFAKIWNPNITLCHRCGSSNPQHRCQAAQPTARCSRCGTTKGYAFSTHGTKLLQCENGHLIGVNWGTGPYWREERYHQVHFEEADASSARLRAASRTTMDS